MAKIEFSSRVNPAENLLTPIILLLVIVFTVFGIKLKWFRRRLTFNSSESNRPISNSENTNQVFGVYKRNEIDERDFRARVANEPAPSYSATSNQNGESSSSHYKLVKVNNEIKLIPPAPPYTPPTIQQGNIKTVEWRSDFNNNKNTGHDKPNEKKSPKYIRIRKDEYNKKEDTRPKDKIPASQPIQNSVAMQQITPAVHIAKTLNNKPKAAPPLLAPPQPTKIVAPPQKPPPPQTLPPPPPPVVKQEVKIATPLQPSSQTQQPPASIMKQDVKIQIPLINPVSASPPPYSPPLPPSIEVENTALTAKLNSMPTTYIQLTDFDLTKSDDISPPTIRSMKYHEDLFAYDDPITITPSSTYNRDMTYNDKIEIVTESSNDDLFEKMKPTPRTTGINYLDYQSNHNKKRNNNETDDNSESEYNDDVNDYELAPIEFLSKNTTTNAAVINTATVKNDIIQNHIKTTTSTTTTTTTTANTTSNKKDERNIIVDDSDEDDDDDDDNDDADDDNTWDLVARHRQNVGRKVEWEQSGNVNSKMKQNQRAMMNSIVATDKPKTLRELHSQSRENNRMPLKATTSKSSNEVSFGELDDEADA